jgi:alpha-beta hydrolase superfamily lysophospholipase
MSNTTISPDNSGTAIGHRAAAVPVTFYETVGLYMPVSVAAQPCDVAVLFASPWGLEEMSSHKFFRQMADMLADRGISSLRFDYPGTGDALGDPAAVTGLDVWSQCLAEAGRRLSVLSGCSRIIVVSQGIGAVVTQKAAGEIAGLAGAAFLAPVVSGRTHIRELAVWSKVVDDNLGLRDDQRTGESGVIASFVMPKAIVEDVRKTNLRAIEATVVPRALVVGRADRPTDAEFAETLRGLGVVVETAAFEGYDQLVANPTVSRMPVAVIDHVVSWVAGLAAEAKRQPDLPIPPVLPLDGAGFSDLPVRFGKNDHLSGMLCRPTGTQVGATVIFLTSAYDRKAGWGRATVKMARALAQTGIASLRFDTASTGDSPPVPGRPEQVLYHETQNADVFAAIDFVEELTPGPVMTAGRCSGAYLGLQASLADPRIRGNVSVNPAVFHWKEGRSVEEAVVQGTRSLNDYGRRMLNRDTFARIFQGEIDIRAALRNIARGIGGRIRNRLLHAFRHVLPEGRKVYGSFRTLSQRGMPLALIYSENDIGLDAFHFFFGRDGEGLKPYGNTSVTMIPDADHNLTPPAASAIYLETVRLMAIDIGKPAKT